MTCEKLAQWKNLGEGNTWFAYTLLGKKEREWEKALCKGSINVGYDCSWLFGEMGRKARGIKVKAMV